MPGRGTASVMFYREVVTGNIFSEKEGLFYTYLDLEKAFDLVHRNVVWWAFRTESRCQENKNYD